MTDISIIITGHREGIIAGPTLRTAHDAVSRVSKLGAKTEIIVVLDRADSVTKTVFNENLDKYSTIIETDYGDPGAARNRGINEAKGIFSTFLDADDLWSENWLDAAWQAAKSRPDAIWHSNFNITFGEERNIWWHIDSESPLFDADYLRWANYWDSMSFASTQIYSNLPFRENDLKRGFGHEDWHWNAQTIVRGIPHKPVNETVHFKRRRVGSQMMSVLKADAATIWPD